MKIVVPDTMSVDQLTKALMLGGLCLISTKQGYTLKFTTPKRLCGKLDCQQQAEVYGKYNEPLCVKHWKEASK